jgi:hypothetical protein
LGVIGVASSAEGESYLEGQEQARKDIKATQIKYMLYGEPQAHDQLFGEILKKDYKITLIVVGGCTVSEQARIRANGYNRVILDHLKGQSKKDIIKEAEGKARELWAQEHTKAEPVRPANSPMARG